MGQILITFAEEGQQPASFIVPPNIADKLDRFVADSGVYQGKAHMFLSHNMKTLLEPIIRRYPDAPDPAVADLLAQKAQLEQQIAQAQAASYQVIVPVVPDPPAEEPIL